jgi:hypothetical protein
MDLDTLKDQWRQHLLEEAPAILEARTIMAIVTAQAAAIRRDVRRRLRREASYYFPMFAIALAPILSGVTVIRLGFAAGLTVLLAGIAATLWVAQRRITETPRDGSLRDILLRLRAKIDAAARAYLAAYVATFATSAIVLAAAVAWRHGPGIALVTTLGLGVVATWWSYRSGCAYVERLFRRERANLADCLEQLNEAEYETRS